MGASIKVGAETRVFQQEMQKVVQNLKLMQSELGVVTTRTNLYGTEQEKLQQKTKELQLNLSSQTKILELQRKALASTTSDITKYKDRNAELVKSIEKVEQSLKDEIKANGEGSQKAKELQKELQGLQREYTANSKAIDKSEKATTTNTISINQSETALIELQHELEETNRRMEQTTHSIDTNSEGFKNMQTNLDKTSTAMFKIVAPLLAVSVASSKLSMDFEEGMAKVSTIADDTQVSMEDLGNSATEISSKYAKASTEVAEGLYQVMSAGVETKDSIEFLDLATKNSIAGFTDVTTSVDTLTTVINAYGLEVAEATRISDEMLVLQKYGKTTIGEMGESLGAVAPLAANVNVSTKELFSSLAVLTKNGIESSEAVTAMKAVLSNVLKPSEEAAKSAKELGINFTASGLKAKGFSEFLEDVIKKSHGNTETMVELFGSVKALNAMMVLTSKEGSADFTEALGMMENSAGETDKAFGKMADTTGFKLKQTVENMKNSLIEIGNALAPLLETILDIVKPLVSWLGKLNPQVVQFIGYLTVVVTITAVVIKIITTTMGLMTALAPLTLAANITAGKTVLIILAVVAALTALAIAISVIVGKGNQMKEVYSSMGDATKNLSASNKMPKYARGVSSHPGGLAVINDGMGGEIVDLPNGSRVIPHDISMRMAESNNKQSNGDTYIFNVKAEEIDDIVKLKNMINSLKQNKRQFA